MPLETGPQLQDLPIRPADHFVVDVEDEARRCRAPRAGAAERLAARNCKVPDCCEAGAHPGFRVPQHCYHVENPSPRSVTPGRAYPKVHKVCFRVGRLETHMMVMTGRREVALLASPQADWDPVGRGRSEEEGEALSHAS